MHLRRRHLCSLLILTAVSATGRGEASSPAAAGLAALRAGNATFAANPAEPWTVEGFRGVNRAPDAAPLAVVLSCADTTVPPEVLFRARPGSLFVIRTAGPIADPGSLAGVEFAVGQLHAPLLVVMGHEACGIVRSSLSETAPDPMATHFETVRKKLRPIAMRAAAADGGRLRLAILETVEEQINELLQASSKLRREAENGALTLVGAYYEHTSGLVHFSQPVQVMAEDGARQPH